MMTGVWIWYLDCLCITVARTHSWDRYIGVTSGKPSLQKYGTGCVQEYQAGV